MSVGEWGWIVDYPYPALGFEPRGRYTGTGEEWRGDPDEWEEWELPHHIREVG